MPETAAQTLSEVKAAMKINYFDDPAFLSHIAMLEQNYTRRAEAEIFI